MILLTGFGDEMKAQPLPGGIDLVIAKPVSIADLRVAISSVLVQPEPPADFAEQEGAEMHLVQIL